ncbi:FUSC family protein [Microbacterium sp.]|uniref:FUSC family protein n=1 Tax=Microbacterium sp. TaxID=51671 RepID=UPI0026103309|nr:FUSC family protein [Microbacterium sp.]MCV0335870.1 FUSC family protein [Microbacterium sp.]MCV0376750.1 FUSC family protein [Microbacterium sp.]MCV0391499.1 FUSC family protein [Microbacterium sp.]MCV0420141.1 FUSC family protein [Microbacterium sp.]MCV0423724.1 FUSC family protein [Microbacterium sp.]
MRIPAAIRASQRSPLLQVVKSAAATIAAWLIAGWVFPAQLPVFAAIAALLVVQPSVNQSLSKALERSIGVIAGVVIAVALGLLLGSPSWIVLLAIVVAMLVAWIFRASPGTGNQVAISAMLVLALGSSSPEYAFARIVETLIGVVIGIVVNALIVPPVLVAPARRDVGLLGLELAASLDRLADAQTPARLQELMLEVRLLRPMKEAAEASIAAGEESLTLNPRRSTHRADLREMRALLDRLSPIVTQTIGMTRAYFDHYDDRIGEEPAVAAIAEQLRRAGHDVRLAVQVADASPEPDTMTSAIPALTAPLVIRPPSSQHWILIGSLMEDLRRIRGELLDED